MARTNDLVYEIAFRLMGSTLQERIWTHMLTSLSGHFGVAPQVELTKTCIDPRLQWSEMGNLRYNAQMFTMMYTLTSPVRRVFRRGAK